MLQSLLTPLVGVLFGAVLLGDSIDLRFAPGACLVLIGVLIVNLQLILKRCRAGRGRPGRLIARLFVHDILQGAALLIAMKIVDKHLHAQIQPIRMFGAVGAMRRNEDIFHAPQR
jgi:hypothetical protein